MKVIAIKQGFYDGRVIERGEEFELDEKHLKPETKTTVLPARDQVIVEEPTGKKLLPSWVVESSEETRKEVPLPESVVRREAEEQADREVRALQQFAAGQREVLSEVESEHVVREAEENPPEDPEAKAERLAREHNEQHDLEPGDEDYRVVDRDRMAGRARHNTAATGDKQPGARQASLPVGNPNVPIPKSAKAPRVPQPPAGAEPLALQTSDVGAKVARVEEGSGVKAESEPSGVQKSSSASQPKPSSAKSGSQEGSE